MKIQTTTIPMTSVFRYANELAQNEYLFVHNTLFGCNLIAKTKNPVDEG